MPVRRIGQKRASLMFSGEIYKNAARKYLESMGYSKTTDSYTEGHLIDMIFYNREIAVKQIYISQVRFLYSVTKVP